MIELSSDCLILEGVVLPRRTQSRPLVLPESDLSILARGVATSSGGLRPLGSAGPARPLDGRIIG
jgi:hypothetical protein